VAPPLPWIRTSLSERTGDGQVCAGFAGILGAEPADLPRGTAVQVFDERTGQCGYATVAGRDFDQDLIFLAVDWDGLREGGVAAQAGADDIQLWPPVEWFLEWLGNTWRANAASFRRARCRKKGHKREDAGRFAWPPVPGRVVAQVRCPRCGEVRPFDQSIKDVRASQRVA
jgi:hypothetical protein